MVDVRWYTCVCAAILTLLQGIALGGGGGGGGGGEDDIIDKPLHGSAAEVMFVSAFVPDDNIRIYANGRRQSVASQDYDFAAGEGNVIRLPPAPSHMVAIAATPEKRSRGGRPDDRPPAGIIASLEQHTATPKFATTDATWRCRHGTAAMLRLKDKKTGLKWYETHYNDAKWPSAKVLGKHGARPWKNIVDVSSAAKWIWADTDDETATVLCRGYFSHNPDLLHISADSRFRVYADGRYLGNGSKPEATFHFPIPGRADHLVAVHAEFEPSQVTDTRGGSDNGPLPGILASIQTPSPPGGVSGTFWKCTSKLQADAEREWMLESFDDSAWPHASIVEAHDADESSKGVRLDISQHAAWVWVGRRSRNAPPSRHAYCRAVMSSNLHANNGKGQLNTASDGRTPKLHTRQLQPLDQFDSVTEVKANMMDGKTFFRNFLSKGRPFVIRGGVAHWPAVEKWNDDYLTEKIGHDQAMLTYAPTDIFFFYGVKQDIRDGTVGDFLQEYRRPGRKENIYMAQHPLQSNEERSAVRDDVERPKFSSFMKLEDAYMWMGGGDQVTPIHFDNSENIMCMVTGKKRVRLYEPVMSNYLYPITHDRHVAITSSIKNLSAADLKAYPDFANAKSVDVTLEGGDMLFLPAYWWHEVTSLGRNIAVNWWFNSHSFVLDSFYNDWIEGLPQTEWGAKRMREQEKDLREQTSPAGHDGRIREEL